MKKNYYNFSELIKDRIVLVMTGAVMLTGNLAAQTSYSFTSAGLSGSLAPTQGQITTAYASTNLNNSVTVTGNGIQQFTLPFGGNYEITCYGPQGGNSSDNNNGGLGAKIQGEFNFAAGTVLDIVVGHRGASSTSNASGGGAGGSGVRQGSTLLIVAGGGGGAGRGNVNVMGASNTNNGTASTTGAIMGGTGGNGGNAIGNNGGGCGGGGYLTQGAKPPGGTPNQAGPGGFAATGGARSIWCGGTSGAGGFGVGGGGGAEDQYGGAGGGGGYSGGAGGEWGNSGWCGTPAAAGGGGGGSYNTGANPVNTGSFVSGDGMVVIKFMCSAPLSGATSICSGQSTTLTINALGNILWSNGSTQPSVVLSPAVTTQYSVTGTGTPNGCTSTQIFSVIVNPLPVITTTVTPALLCVGSQATLAASGASTYVWSTGPTGTTTTASPIVTTNYSVTGTSSAGCVSTFVFPLNVNALQLSISGNTVICNGKQTTLTGGGGTSLAWAGYGPFGSISPSPTITTGYTLTGIDPNNCLNTLTTSILVNPTPTVQVAASKTLACKGEAVTFTVSGTGVTSYTWSPSAGSSNNAVISISHPINTVYSYSAAGSDNNGCVGGSNSIAVKVELCTGINELNGGAERISVYPNPSNGNFSIRAEAGAQLTIVNQLGQSVANYTTANDKEIQLKDLAKGIYFITFEKGEVKQTKKVIVE